MGNSASSPAAVPTRGTGPAPARDPHHDLLAVARAAARLEQRAGTKAQQPRPEESQYEGDTDLLRKITGLQQQLAEVSASPLLGLQDAAERLAEQLQVDLVSVWVIPRGEPAASVLLAAQGKGAAELQRDIVLRHQAQGKGRRRLGCPCSIDVADALCPEAPRVEPSDLWQGSPALRSFLQTPIGPPESPLGVLLLAKKAPGAFEGVCWQLQLQLAATALVPHVRHPQVARMAQLLRRLDGLEDPVAMIGALLRGAGDFMLRGCSLATSPRIALLQPSGADAASAPGSVSIGASLPASRGEALLFELPQAASHASLSDSGQISSFQGSGAYKDWACAPEDAEEVVASRLKLQHTLLTAAIAQQQARFVADVGAYMQACPRPARDVFTRSSRLVSSIVVIPLVAGHKPPLGGLYFALDAPCEFTNIQDTLLGFIAGATPLLFNKLAGKAAALARAMRDDQQAAPAAADGGSGPIQLLPGGGAAGSAVKSDLTNLGASSFSSSSGSERHQQGAYLLSSATSASGRLPTISSSDRVNTEAMLMLMQRDITASWRRRREARPCAAEVAVGELLGQDGCGAVCKGTWHKVPVAVKVMPARPSEREAMQGAVEMAVLSSVRHPNVATVYACLTDMVETADGAGSRSASASASRSLDLRTYYRRLAPEEDHDDLDTYNVVVMEPCDRGTLRDAISRGLLHVEFPDGALGVNFPRLLALLTDVAHALQYLHGMQLVHGNVKLDSVLLKADRTRPLGVTPKLAGFGRARILHGCELIPAADVAAFGLLMYEAYTADRAFKGKTPEQAAAAMANPARRPLFHASTPPAFAQLAQACWAADPAARPTAGQVVQQLDQMASELSRRAV